MSRNISRAALGAATVLCVFAFAACTGEPGPIVTETPSPLASVPLSPSPSASPTPLTDAELLALMPPDAAYPDARGAVATAVFFVEQFSVVYETSDLRVWDALSMPECIFCGSVRDSVLKEQAVGDFETGGEMTIDSGSVVANYYDVDGYWYVTFRYSQSPSSTVHSDGTTEPSGDGGTGSTSMRMTSVDGVWKVSGVEAVPD